MKSVLRKLVLISALLILPWQSVQAVVWGEPDDTDRDLAIGYALDLKRMQSAKIANLLERQYSIVDQPHGGGLGH